MAITIVEDVLSAFGLRVMHAVDFTGPVSADELREKIPAEGRELATFYASVDRDLKMFHLHAAWQAREMVDFTRCMEYVRAGKFYGMKGEFPLRYGVLWYIMKGETMSTAIELAADMYQAETGRFPSVVWMRKKPDGAPEVYEIVRDGSRYIATLQEAEWVPERFIVAGIPVEDWDVVWKDGKWVEGRKPLTPAPLSQGQERGMRNSTPTTGPEQERLI